MIQQDGYSKAEYLRKKQSLNLNEKLKQYFSVLQNIIDGKSNIGESSVISNQMIRAYSQLNPSEKGRYITENLQYLHKAINNRISKRNSFESNYSQALNDNKSIETTCEIGKRHMLVCFRVYYNFILDKNKKIITVENKKNGNKIYNLRHYLVHVNKKSKNQIILESVKEMSEIGKPSKQQIFTFQASLAERIYQQIWKCIMSFRNQQLLFLLSSHQHDKHYQKHARVFLNHRNFKSLMNFKQKSIAQVREHPSKWVTLYQKKKTNGQSYLILQSRIKDQHIKLDAILQKSCANVKKQFLEMMEQPHKRCSLIQENYILEEYQEIYQAVYQKLKIHGHNFQLIYIKDTYPTKNILSKTNKSEDILFIKGIQNILVVNFLEFMLVTVTPITDQVTKLTLYCSFNMNHIINSKLAKIYLLGLLNQNKQIIQRQNKEYIQMNSAQMLYKENNQQNESSIIDNQHQIFFDFGDPEQGCDELYSIVNQSFTSQSQSQKNNQNKSNKYTQKTTIPKKNQQTPLNNSHSPITHKYELAPLKNYNIMDNIEKQHFLWKDWKRRKNGGVTCNNLELMEKQKKLFKEVITSMGSQILKGGNILNVSLPVTIFKKQSHIQMLAKNMVYAPLLLQNRNDALQRVKYSVLFSLSFSATGISLDKPFFTFLGETVQYWIGGCPAYVEQITRYPPISAYLFMGRGYRIHGQVDPKISFGINGVKGYSERPIFIEFDDGTVIQLVVGKMVISGLFIGERQFNFYDKVYVFDKTHFLFAELTYGPKKSSIFEKSQQPSDYYSGYIYEVSPQYMKTFEKQIPREYPTKKHILKTVSIFNGIWNDKAYFDNQQYFDFKTQLPCIATRDQNPLPSDSSFRPQLIKLIEGNTQESQKLKIIAQEDQRRDRKLRKKYQDKNS